MASALQKLFRKRISKQQVQEQRQRQQQQLEQQQRDSSARKQAESKAAKEEARLSQQQPRYETQPYLTVSSLNSPSSSSSYFPFSSKLSLDSCSALSIAEGQSTPTYHNQTFRESSSSAHYDIRPRAASLSAQSMLRDASDNGRTPGWSSSAARSERDLRDPQVDQFGNLVSSEQQGVCGGGNQDEEDDLETNAIYSVLSKRPSLKLDWEKTKLVLVPSQVDMIGEKEMANDDYVALHAFVPSTLFKDQYVSVRSDAFSPGVGSGTDIPGLVWSNVTLSATLESESRSVHIQLSDAAQKTKRIEYDVGVRGETTIYRSMSTIESRESAASRTLKQSSKRPGMVRRERVRIRVLFIDDSLVPDSVNAQLEQIERHQAGLNGELIAFPHRSQTDLTNSPPPSPLLPSVQEDQDDVELVPSTRQFVNDFALLLDPPAKAQKIEKPLRSALDTLLRAASDFTKAYVYVSGFDAYNVSRIRKGILAKAWQSFETCWNTTLESGRPEAGLSAEDQALLLLLLENVVMGHCHGKVYKSIRSAYQRADEDIDHVVGTYQTLNVSLEDFGVRLPALCRRASLLQDAIFTMQHLGEPDEDMEQILNDANADNLRALARLGDVHRTPLKPFTMERSRSRIRTPLDVLDVLHTTLEQIGSILDKVQKPSIDAGKSNRTSVGTDELLPVLAYVVVQAGCSKLASLLYYVRLFGLSDVTSSHNRWALVTHEAVLEYLRKDPLQLCASKSPASSIRAASPQTPGLYYVNDAVLDHSQIDGNFTLEHDGRGRRNSLPTNALLSAAEMTPNAHTMKPELGGSPLPSSASVYELRSSTSLSSESSIFKTPGRPASSYAERPRSRLMSALDSVGEDGSVNVASSSASLAQSFSGRKLSRRTTSMTGSSDLMIRPQIVVRSRTVASQRFQQQAETGQSPADDASVGKEKRIGRAAEKMRIDSSRMSRTNSEESPMGRMGAGTPNGFHGHLRQARRQSVDSWNSFSFFGGHAATPEKGSAGNKETSPASSVAGHTSAAPLLASPSFSWLSSWSSDWGQGSRRKEVRQGESGGSVSPTAPGSDGRNGSDDAQSKSCALQSPETPLREWTFPQSASATSKLSSLAPTLPSPCSPKYLTSDRAARDMLYQPDTARKTPSLCSNTSSSSHSHQPNVLGNSSSSNISVNVVSSDAPSPSPTFDFEKRKRKSSRVRLLSTSKPGAPLPPQVYPELASGDHSHKSKANESGEAGSRSNKTLSKDGRHLFLSSYSLAPSPSFAAIAKDGNQGTHHHDLQPNLEDLTPRSLSPTFAFFPPTLGTIQIPTPVDENTDPMARVPLTT